MSRCYHRGMRLAVIADIHGNLLALDAVLGDIASRNVDLTVNLGDVVSGPLQPAETAEHLMPLALPTVSGNHERQLLTLAPEQMGESDSFTHARLSPLHRGWLAGFPSTLDLEGRVLLCHGTPSSDVDYLLETVDASGCRAAAPGDVAARAGATSASLILCGHTHIPRKLALPDGRVVLNPGSVGLQAYDAKWPYPHVMQTGSPHARYAIADHTDGVWHIEFLQVAYDWDAAAELAAANGRPDWARTLRTGIVG